MKKWFMKIALDFFMITGFLWTITEIIDYLFNDIVKNLITNNEVNIYYGLIIVLVILLIKNYPKRKIVIEIENINSKITIREGNITKTKNHICIASSNYFNTSLDIISPKSILGQIIRNDFNGDNKLVDIEIEHSLREKQFVTDQVRKGKEKSYEIGTLAIFTKKNGKKAILLALIKIDEATHENRFQSSSNYKDTCLQNLWSFVRFNLNDDEISLPIIGTGLSKTTDNNMKSIIDIVVTYAKESKISRINSGIEIIVSKNSLEMNNFDEMRKFLKYLV